MRSPFRARGLPAETYASWRASIERLDGAPLRILAWARGQDGFVVGSPAVLSIGGTVAASSSVDGVDPGPGAAEADEMAGDGDPGDERGDRTVAADAEPRSDEDLRADGDVEAEAAAEGSATRSATPSAERAAERAAERVAEGAAAGAAEPDGDGWRHVAWHRIEHGGWNAESRSLSWTLYGGRRGRVALAEPGRLPELFRERVAASIVVERFVPIRGERGVTVTARRDLGASGEVTWHSTLTRGLSWSVEGVAEEAARASAELRSEYGSSAAGW